MIAKKIEIDPLFNHFNQVRDAYETKENAYLQIVVNLSQDVLTVFSTSEILQKLQEHMIHLFHNPILAIGLFNEENERLDFWGLDIHKAIQIGHIHLSDSKVYAVHSFLNQKEIIFNQPVESHHLGLHFSNVLFKQSSKDRKSFLYMPLSTQKKTIGVLTLQSMQENEFDPQKLILMRSICNMITIALENSIAYQQIDMQRKVIENKSQALVLTLNNLEEIVKKRTRKLESQQQLLLEQATQLENANKELSFLSLVAKHTDNAIMIMDGKGNILWINECFHRLYGYRFDEFIDARGSNILQTSFNSNIHSVIQTCIEKGEPQVYKALNITNTGGQVWTQTTLTPIYNEKNELIHLITIDTDISSIIEAEKLIIESTDNIKKSIRYASRIQRAILPPIEYINQIFQSNFILYMPRDVVSGDFYWAGYAGKRRVIVAADCTGHGVPGALMSMMAISHLQELIKSNASQNSGLILNQLRDKILESLYQTGVENELHDGLDISICIIDDDCNEIQFSGAYQSMYLYREGSLYEYKGDKMPIGMHPTGKKNFSTQRIHYKRGDKVYLFTDGYESQFGGKRNKKFLRRQFRQLVHSTAISNVLQQRQILKNEFIRWMGLENEQTDDVLVLCVEI